MQQPPLPSPVASVLDLVGRTPVVALGSISPPGGATIFAKMESLNPGGSVKDRLGIGLIRYAEEAGVLEPGSTIIEPTAGNTGIGLALVGSRLGYRVILVVPEHFSVEKRELMRALGGEVILTPKDDGMRGAIAKAHELAATIPKSYVPEQFSNPFNSRVHYETTGPELFEQMDGRIDAFVAGVGSGGTFTGAVKYLRERLPSMRAVVVETEGSVLQGGPAAPHEVEGIGASFVPPVLDMSLIDEFVVVNDPPAFAMVARLAREEGILAGSSSGANVAGALQIAGQLPEGARVVTVIADAAERYMSKGIFSKWRDGV